MCTDGKEAREVMLQAANGIDWMERSWSPNCIHAGHAGSIVITGNQLRQDLHRWLLPPDPSTNYNIASSAHHEQTATWFFNGNTYKEWKSVGSKSLLWIHGKCVPLSHSTTRHGLITSLIYSWLQQEHTLVCTALVVFVKKKLSQLSFPAPQSSRM